MECWCHCFSYPEDSAAIGHQRKKMFIFRQPSSSKANHHSQNILLLIPPKYFDPSLHLVISINCSFQITHFHSSTFIPTMAAKMVADALLSNFVQMTIDSLASRFKDYFRGRKLNTELLSKMKVKLQAIDVFADDAELKQFRDARVRDWLFKAKDVVFELSKCQVEAESQSIRNKVWNFFKSSSVSSFDKEIESRIEQILGDLDDLESRSGYLGLTRTSGDGVGSGSYSVRDIGISIFGGRK